MLDLGLLCLDLADMGLQHMVMSISCCMMILLGSQMPDAWEFLLEGVGTACAVLLTPSHRS